MTGTPQTQRSTYQSAQLRWAHAVLSPGGMKHTTLDQALTNLLEHTARRVRDQVRSPATLAMQVTHAEWFRRQLVPAGVFAANDNGAPIGLTDLPLDAFTTPALVALLEHWRTAGGVGGRMLSLITVAKRKSTLRRALRVAVERGELDRVPVMPEIGLPPLRPRLRILRTYAELVRLLAALPPRRRDWVQLALWTCQRPGDVERMAWSDIDLRSPTSMIIRSTKTRKPHGIRAKMPRPLVSVLAARVEQLTAAGTPPAPGDPIVESWPGVSKVLPVVCVRIGLPPLSAMGLRHTGFSWMVRRTGLTVAAQKWGGWSDFNMLQAYYAHELPAGLTDAADELGSMAANDNSDDGKAR